MEEQKGNTGISFYQFQYSLDRIYTENANIDNRVSITISFSSLVFTAAGLLLSARFVDVRSRSHLHFWAMVVLGFLAILFFSLSILCFLRALGLESSRKEQKKKSYCLHYADVTNFATEEDYRRVCLETDDKDYIHQLIHEIYTESAVCKKKHQLFDQGLIAVVIFMIIVFSMALVVGLSLI